MAAGTAPKMTERSPFRAVPQYQTSTTGAPDAVAEVVGFGSGVSADPNLIEGPRAPAAEERAKQDRIAVADYSP